jgi:hypothetical protein
MKNPGQKAFSAKTRNTLARKGIRVIGSTAVGADASDRYYSATAYVLDDNGTHRVRTFRDVLALAE